MQRPASLRKSASVFAVSVLAAAVLAACGGGGSTADTSSATAVDNATATIYAANATQIGSDTTSVADAPCSPRKR